jgi:hydrogenase maturation protein HypF
VPAAGAGTGAGEIRVADLVRALVRAHARGADSGALALHFHRELAARLAGAALAASQALGLRAVCLTGGCFQNRILLAAVCAQLERAGATPLVHRRLPPNDGGLAAGQACVARAAAARGGPPGAAIRVS